MWPNPQLKKYLMENFHFCAVCIVFKEGLALKDVVDD